MTQATSVPDCFFLQDSRSPVGSNAMWWAENGGYTSDLSKAQRYTREDAQAQHNSRHSDVPWPAAYVEAKSRIVVDMQYLKLAEVVGAPGPFYIQDITDYDGNDCYWVTGARRNTTLLREALTFDAVPAVCLDESKYRVWPVAYVERKCRPTADIYTLSQADALDGAGITLHPPTRPRAEKLRCASCGGFLSSVQYYASTCPRCGAENRP